MAASNTRKSLLLLTLAASLMVGLAALVIRVLTDDDLRVKLEESGLYYVLGLSIIGTVLLVLSGYVWDQGVMQRLRTLRTTAAVPGVIEEDDMQGEPDHDEIIGLARNIERMAQALQKTEASYRGIVEDQVDLICRFRLDGKLTFVNSAYAQAFARKRNELMNQPFPLFTAGGATGD